MATLLGNTQLAYGGQPTATGYIVESTEDGGADIDMEDVENASGTRRNRIIFKKDEKLRLNLIKTTGVPTTDWPEGAMAAVTGFTTYFVDSCTEAESKGATRVTVNLTKINLTDS